MPGTTISTSYGVINPDAFIGNKALPNAGVTALAIGTSTLAATGSTIINNYGTLIGRIALDSATNGNYFNNFPGGVWAVSDSGLGTADATNFGGGTGPNTLNNSSSDSIWISGPTATFSGLQVLLNSGTIYAGNSPCASPATLLCTAAGSVINFNATAGAAQTVFNSNVIEVNGHVTFDGTDGRGFVLPEQLRRYHRHEPVPDRHAGAGAGSDQG